MANPPCQIPECNRRIRTALNPSGLCLLHRKRLKRHGSTDSLRPQWGQEPVERFHSSYEVTDEGCWEWKTHRIYSGYGQFWDGTKLVSAHRYSYQLLQGPIPVGLELDHLCRNRGCVNVDHLEPVTHEENGRRAVIARGDLLTRTHS